MYNNFVGLGSLTRDPKFAGEGSKRRGGFTLATSMYYGDGREKTFYVPCVTFGKLSEIVEKSCKKGTTVFVQGIVNTYSYITKSGEKKYTTNIMVNKIRVVSGGSTDKAQKKDPEEDFPQEDDDIPL